jgi:MFS family permease
MILKNKLEQMTSHAFYPWLVWGLAAGFFFLDYFARVAPAVMTDQLMHDFNIMGLAFGLLSASFLCAYIPMQVPVGMLADRYNSRWLLTINVLVCVLGCVVFTLAHGLYAAMFGRFLLGFGASFAFVTALKLATIWFPPQRFGLLAGLTQALGMLGASISQAPMAYSVGAIGWRSTMWIIIGLLFLLAIAIAVLVRDKSTAHAQKLTNSRALLSGLGRVLKNPQTWWNALFVGLLYAPTEIIGESWGVKFFRQTHDLSNEVAALATGFVFLGWAFGGPIGGWISDYFKKRKAMMILSALFSFIFMSIALFVPDLPLPMLFLMLFLYGLSNTGVATSYAVAAEINSRQLAGTSMAFANMASVLIGVGFQPFIGWLLDKKWDGTLVNGIPVYSAHDFRMVMIALPICLLLAAIIGFAVRETHCQVRE